MSTTSIVRDGDPRRRELLQTAAALATVGSAALVGAGRPATAAPDAGMFAYVGAFTTAERKGHGDGINVYRMDSRTGGWTHVQLLSGIVNPSFLALDHQQRFLYSVHADLDEVSAYSIDKNSGELTPLNKQSSGGKNPVYLTLDPSNRYIVTANYTAGSVGVVSVEEDGTLGPRTDLVTLTGETGPNRKEQAGSHPHDCPFDPAGRFVVVPDKGLEPDLRLSPARGERQAGGEQSAIGRNPRRRWSAAYSVSPEPARHLRHQRTWFDNDHLQVRHGARHPAGGAGAPDHAAELHG